MGIHRNGWVLFSVNVYVFIPMILFHNKKSLKVIKNGYR